MRNLLKLVETWILCGLTGFAGNCVAAQPISLSFKDMVNLTLKNNTEIIQSKGELERAQISQKSIYRLNVPNFGASLSHYEKEIEESTGPSSTDQQMDKIDLSLSGKYVPWGTTYTFSQSYNNETQDKFLTFPKVKRDGREISLGLEYDLLEGAGFRVGKLPNMIAVAETRIQTSLLKTTTQLTLKTLLSKYLDVTLTQRQIENARALLAQAENLDKHYRRLYSEGKMSRIEILSSEIQSKNLHASITRLTLQKQSQLRQLFNLAGTGIPTGFDLDFNLQPLDAKQIALEKLDTLRTNFNLSANPEIANLESKKKLKHHQIAELKNKVLPTLKIVGGHSWQKNPPGSSFITEDDSHLNQWFVGVKFEMPVDNVGAKADLVAKQVEISSLDAQRSVLEKTIEVGIQEYFVELQLLEEQLKQAIEIEKLGQERYQSTIPLLEKSYRSQIDVFDFQNQIREQQFLIAELQASVIRTKSEILYLAGAPLIRGY